MAVTQEEIDLLKAAIAAKIRGESVASISAGGRSVSYAQMSLAEMEGSLARMEAELAGKSRRGFIKPFFG